MLLRVLLAFFWRVAQHRAISTFSALIGGNTTVRVMTKVPVMVNVKDQKRYHANAHCRVNYYKPRVNSEQSGLQNQHIPVAFAQHNCWKSEIKPRDAAHGASTDLYRLGKRRKRRKFLFGTTMSHTKLWIIIPIKYNITNNHYKLRNIAAIDKTLQIIWQIKNQ